MIWFWVAVRKELPGLQSLIMIFQTAKSDQGPL